MNFEQLLEKDFAIKLPVNFDWSVQDRTKENIEYWAELYKYYQKETDDDSELIFIHKESNSRVVIARFIISEDCVKIAASYYSPKENKYIDIRKIDIVESVLWRKPRSIFEEQIALLFSNKWNEFEI